MLRQTVYNGRGNEILLVPYIDGVPVDAAGLDRLIIDLVNDDGGTFQVDSDALQNSSAITFGDDSGYVLDLVRPVVKLALGTELIPARDDWLATFTFFSTTFPLGQVWDEQIALDVRD